VNTRAVVVDDSGFRLIDDRPIPEPLSGEVLVKVLACGTCGSDLHVFERDLNYDWVKEHFPLVMGHEIVGRRASEPEGAAGALVVVRPRANEGGAAGPTRIGWDRPGGFADFVTVPEECLFEVAPHVSVTSAALSEPLAVAAAALRRAGVSSRIAPGFTAQVVGMGAIGILAACALSAEGCADVEVVGTERDRALGSFDLVRQYGLKPVLPEDASGERDLVVNAAGSPVAVTQGLARTGRRGVFVNIALGVGEVVLNMDALTRRDITIVHSYGSEATDWEKALSFIKRDSRCCRRGEQEKYLSISI
jgi:L-iditol 2-dehydrogenase